MKKLLISIIVILLFFVVGCNKQENTESDEIKEENKEIEESITIDVWDIDPIYDFDDIDLHFNSSKIDYKVPCYVDKSNLYGSFDKGGLAIIKNGKVGFMNENCEIKTEVYFDKLRYLTYSNSFHIILEYRQDTYSGYPFFQVINDYSAIEYGSGLGEGYFSYYSNKGVIKSNIVKNMAEINLFDYFLNLGFIKSKDTLVFDSFIESDGYGTAEQKKNLHKDFVEGILTINSDNTILKLDSIPNGYRVNDVSNEMIKLAKYKSVIYSTIDGTVINNEYEDGYGFYEECAAVKKNGKWGYIDKQGNVIVDFIFDKATPLCDGKAWVIYNGHAGKLNIKSMLENNVEFTGETLKVENYELIGKWYKIVADSIRVRKKPSTDSEKVWVLYKGTMLLVYDAKENADYTWYKIGEDKWIADKNGEWIKELQ